MMMENPKRKHLLSRLLKKYLSGDRDTPSGEQIDRWLEDQDSKNNFSEREYQSIQKDILDRVHRHIDTAQQRPNVGRWSLRRWGVYIAAASLGLVAAFGFWMLLGDRPGSGEQLTRIAGQTIEYKIVRTEAGQRSKIVLSDSSVVFLHGNTVLRYSAKYGSAEQRRVILDQGEAFFAVQRDTNRPFIVETAAGENRVLGTSFNIRLKDNGMRYSLSVNTGKVAFLPSGYPESAILFVEKGKQLLYDITKNQISIDDAPMEDLSAWKDNVLRFSSEDWQQIKRKLETWYGLTVHIDPGLLKNQLFTATFRDPKLDKVLEGLQKINGFRYRIEGKEVFIE